MPTFNALPAAGTMPEDIERLAAEYVRLRDRHAEATTEAGRLADPELARQADAADARHIVDLAERGIEPSEHGATPNRGKLDHQRHQAALLAQGLAEKVQAAGDALRAAIIDRADEIRATTAATLDRATTRYLASINEMAHAQAQWVQARAVLSFIEQVEAARGGADRFVNYTEVGGDVAPDVQLTAQQAFPFDLVASGLRRQAAPPRTRAEVAVTRRSTDDSSDNDNDVRHERLAASAGLPKAAAQ